LRLIEEDENFNLISAFESDSVEKVLLLLRNNKISSLPVKKTDSNEIIGTIDVLDLVTYAYTSFAKVSELAQESYPQMEQFNLQKIGPLMNISGRNEFHSIQYCRPFSDLLSLMTNPNIHHVSIINEVKDVVGFLSQFRVIQYFHSHQKELDFPLQKLMKETVDKWLPVNRGPVLTINMKHFMIDAFKLIWSNNVTGVGVVDDEGKLVGNLSASDLKNTKFIPVGELIHDLYQPIKNFLHVRTNLREKIIFAEFSNPQPKIINPDTTMQQVVDIIVKNKIHRVFVVDGEKRPTAVLSLCDIIARFLERGEN